VALGKITRGDVDLVISGINHGPNLGDDVLISGTVGAALQGYLRGFPAIALSLAMDWEKMETTNLISAAKVAALLAARIYKTALARNCLLNINVPDLPVREIKGVKTTHLVHQTHIETVEERANGDGSCYWLERQNIYRGTVKKADITAVSEGYVSLTTLHTVFSRRRTTPIGESFCNELFRELQQAETC
jgi:5'-nucleotidase